MAMTSAASHIAVILIHGIGDLRRFDVLDPARKAVGCLMPDANFDAAPGYADGSIGSASINAISISQESTRITLIEFYWAHVMGKIRLARPFRSFLMLLDIFWAAPMLAIQGSSHDRLRFFCARAIAGWFCLNVVAFPLIGCAALIEEGMYWVGHGRMAGLEDLFRGGILFPAVFSTTTFESIYPPMVAITALLLLFLAVEWVFAELITLAQPTSQAIAPVFWRVMSICGLLIFSISIAFLFLLSATYTVTMGVLEFLYPRIPQGIFGPTPPRHDISLADTVLTIWPQLLGLGVAVGITIVMGNLIRDVVYYLAPDENGQARPHQVQIQNDLWKLIQRVQTAGASQVVLVAHSLGTVILIDTLLKYAHCAATSSQICPIHIVTAGSPIRRLILRLVPNRLKQLPALLDELSGASAIRVASWINTFRVFDYVGQALGYSVLVRSLLPTKYRRDTAHRWFREYALEPQFRFPLSHTNYWGDPRFVDVIAHKVVAPLL